MADILATGEIEENPEGTSEPGFYYRIKSEEETSEWLGPYDSQKAAEVDFVWSLEEAAKGMVTESLGLDK